MEFPPKISSYGIMMWVLGLLIYILNPLYVNLLGFDAKPIAIFGMCFAFPFYFVIKLLEEDHAQ